jgi:hypothetical protein
MTKIRAEAAQGCQEELVSLNSVLIDCLSDKVIAERLAGALLSTTWSMGLRNGVVLSEALAVFNGK